MICFHLERQQQYFVAGPPNPKKYFYYATLSAKGTRKANRLIVSLFVFDGLSQYSTKSDAKYRNWLSHFIRCILAFQNLYKTALRCAVDFSQILHSGRMCYLCRGPPCFDAPYPKRTTSKQEE